MTLVGSVIQSLNKVWARQGSETNLSRTGEPPRFPYIDALRGYAILLVIGAHCMFFFTDIPEYVGHWYPGGGVQLFFVVSAIALLGAWERRQDGTVPFFIRRVFRLGPMWWLAILYWLYNMGMAPRYSAPAGLSVFDVMFNAVFLHGLTPTSLNGLVPGGWSIAAEAVFYLFFPWLTVWATNVRRSIIGFVLALVVAEGAGKIAGALITSPEVIKNGFIDYWFPHQLPVFMAGFCAYYLIRDYPIDRRWAQIIAVTSLLCALLLPGTGFPGRAIAAYAVCWAGLAYGLAYGGARFLTTAPVVVIGALSYSAYFWHFIFLGSPVDQPHITGGMIGYIKLAGTTLALTLSASLVTYNLIEKRGIRLGQRCCVWWRMVFLSLR